jgi:cytochrome c2
MIRRAGARMLSAIVALAGATWAPDASLAADPIAGKAIFERVCHGCHAALPYTGRIGEDNLPRFLANPRRYNPRTAMTFPGLQRRSDIDDVIAYITGN